MTEVRKRGYAPRSLVGQTFGSWTVLDLGNSRTGKSGSKQVYWVCRCGCGVKREVAGSALRAGKSKKCSKCHGLTLQKNYIGRVFGRLTVIARGVRPYHYFCRCSCAAKTIVEVMSGSLVTGTTQSCKCLFRERAKGRPLIHGKSRTSIWYAWRDMISRCYSKSHRKYDSEGGKGIRVCPEWLGKTDGFNNFYKVMGERLPGKSLGRVDATKDYTPGNTIWQALSEKLKRTKHTRLVTYKGREQSVADWAEESGIPYTCLIGRLNNSWTAEEALTQPVNQRMSRRKGTPE